MKLTWKFAIHACRVVVGGPASLAIASWTGFAPYQNFKLVSTYVVELLNI